MPAVIAVLALIVSLAAAASEPSDPRGWFEAGLRRFEEAAHLKSEQPGSREEISRRYLAAAEAFVEAWRAGAATTEILTNAANSYYFAGRTGEAVLFYRRALAADASNGAARSALEHIRAALPIRREASGMTSLSESLFFWHDERFFPLRLWGFLILFPAAWVLFAVELTRHRWGWMRALLVPIFPFALLAVALSYLFGLRRPYAVVGALVLLPALAFLGSLAFEASNRARERAAVVLVEVEGRNGNGETYSLSHTQPFPPGTEVEVLERRGGSSAAWLRVRLRDGSDSWIPEATVERVLPEP